jgi:uncharacterized protein (TIGR00730 family)
MIKEDPIFQTLSEDQFSLLNTIINEYKTGMLALNSLGPQTVTFYGGARIMPSDLAYSNVREVAALFAGRNWSIVSGGGPGIMNAALEGAHQQKGQAVAFAIDIPGEPLSEFSSQVHVFTQFSVRKYMLRQSDAFVFAPGGIGTLDELMELLTLTKTGKYPPKPIFLLDKEFWQGYIKWFEEILLTEHKTITQDVLSLFHLVDNQTEIEQIIFKNQ